MLERGTQLASIWWEPDGEIKLGHRPTEVKEIVIVLENGQRAEVPWAKATHNDGKICLYNMALAAGCMLLKKEQPVTETNKV